MQKILSHLWFDKEAKEAAAFYTSLFPESAVTHTCLIRDTPSGDCDLVSFTLWNQEFMAISAGPYFTFNPSISFIVNFDPLFFGGAAAEHTKAATEKLNFIWSKLADGGKVLMEIGEYPFSKRYGWVQDKYGVSWQLMLTNPEGEPKPSIIPSLLFVKDNYGKVDEALQFYLSVFKNSRLGSIHRYPKVMEPDREGAVMFSDFQLEGTWFAAMESAHAHDFAFNEAISFMVNCDNQQEIDYYWEKLSAVPEAEQCGWLKDKFGVSWQISSSELDNIMKNGTQDQVDKITQAFLPMKKIDIATIMKACQ